MLRGTLENKMFIRDRCQWKEGEGGRVGQREKLNCDADRAKPPPSSIGSLVTVSSLRAPTLGWQACALLSTWLRLPLEGCGFILGCSLQVLQTLRELEIVYLPRSRWLENQVLSWRGTAVSTFRRDMRLLCCGIRCPWALTFDSTKASIGSPEMGRSESFLSIRLGIQAPMEEAGQNNTSPWIMSPVGVVHLLAWQAAYCSILGVSGQSQNKELGAYPLHTMHLSSTQVSFHLPANIAVIL